MSYRHNFFFFNDTATTEIYTLSLHDALPIYGRSSGRWSGTRAAGTAPWSCVPSRPGCAWTRSHRTNPTPADPRSEEHTSELQSQSNLVCRLLLEKKKKQETGVVYATHGNLLG